MATSWAIISPTIGMQPIAETSTTQLVPLGTRVRARDVGSTTSYGEGEFIYAKGVASTAVGSWVFVKEDDWSTILCDTDESGTSKEGCVAVAMSANVANQYGWYQIFGKAIGKALTGFADNADVYLTSTGGSVDDAVVDGYMVHLATGASALDGPGTGLADFEIRYPYVDGIAGND